MLEEKLWPYDGDASHWPPSEPKGVDLQAKVYRICAYQRASTVQQCRISIASKHLVLVAFQIDDSWFEAPKGFIPKPDNQQMIGSHSVSLVGYDDGAQHFIIRNSWGTTWGEAGYGYLPYSYFHERFLEGWIITAYHRLTWPNNSDQIRLRNWRIRDLFGNVLHCAEIVDSRQDEVIAWGFAIQSESPFLELEELFVRPNWRMCGYASRLTKEFLQLGTRLGKQIRAWIPHSDAGGLGQLALNAVLRRLGLSRSASPVCWAAALGTPNIFLDFWLRQKDRKNQG